jgi:hypothetical protein
MGNELPKRIWDRLCSHLCHDILQMNTLFVNNRTELLTYTCIISSFSVENEFWIVIYDRQGKGSSRKH